MSLKHTILGFLNQEKLSGYDLQKKIDNTIDHFWSSTQSQVYRTLKELVDKELIKVKIVYQDDKPNKKLYSITSQGKIELDDWLHSSLEIPNHRNQFLVQFFFSDTLDNKSLIKNLEHYKSVMQERLTFLKSNNLKANVQNENSFKKQKLYKLIAENGIQALKNEINWIEQTTEKIQDEE